MPARLHSNENNRSILIDKPILFVGRHPDCDLFINTSRKVSRKHCCLAEVNGKFLVRDLGSTNGVLVNGKRVTGTHPLQDGDLLTIGDCPFTFQEQLLSPPRQNTSPQTVNRQQKPELRDPVTPIQVPVDHEVSSEIPIMIDEPESDGFDIFGANKAARNEQERKNRNRLGSDSQVELAVD